MTQPGSVSDHPASAAVDVAASLDDACVRIHATANAARFAMTEVGRMSNHRALQTFVTFQAEHSLVSDGRVKPLISPAIDVHLQLMRSLYLERIEEIEDNAAKRMMAIADWTPPKIGLLESLLRFVGVYFISRRRPRDLTVDDVLHGMVEPQDATEGDNNDGPLDTVHPVDDLHHRQEYEYTILQDAVGLADHSNGTVPDYGNR